MPHQIFWWRVGPRNSDLLKLGTVLTYAFNFVQYKNNKWASARHKLITCEHAAKREQLFPQN